MKKLIFLFAVLLTIGTTRVLGISTYDAPYAGYTHHYTATVTDGDSNNPVRWYVLQNDDATKAVHGTEYSFVTAGYNGTTDQLEGTAVYDVQITWENGVSSGDIFYVYIEVDDFDLQCTNVMKMRIDVADPNFNVLAYSVTGTADPATATNGDGDLTGCPDDVVDPLWDGSGHTDIGTTELIFKVERQNSSLAWDFEYSVNDDGTELAGLVGLSIVSQDGTIKESDVANTNGIISMDLNQNYALVYVTITNVQATVINVDFDVLADGDTKDSGDNLDTNADNIEYTIKPIAEITGFSGS